MALVILLNALFTGAVFFVFLRATLVAAWFAFTTGELWLLAGIRKVKMQGGESNADQGNKTLF